MYDDNDLVISVLIDAVGEGEWKRAHCPFCESLTGKPDKRRSLGIHQSGFFHCFKCFTRGKLEESDEWVPVETEVKGAPVKVILEPPQGFTPIGFEPVRSSRSFSAPVTYMCNRGISDEIMRAAYVGACITGDYCGRIVIPVFDLDDTTWLGYIARDWTDTQELRYRYPKGMQRGTIFYEQRVLEVETDEPALVVEGGFDILPYYGYGGACMGKPSKWQIEMFKTKAKRPLAIALDGDAWMESWALAQQLRLAGVRAGAVRLPASEDPNTMAKKHGVNWLLDKAHECINEGI